MVHANGLTFILMVILVVNELEDTLIYMDTIF